MTEDGVVINRFVNNRLVPSNAGQLKYKGFESGATWTPTQKLTAYVNGAFYRNRYGDFVIQSSSGDTSLTGNRLILSLSGRNLLNQEFYFDAGSSSAHPGPPRQVLLSTTIRVRYTRNDDLEAGSIRTRQAGADLRP